MKNRLIEKRIKQVVIDIDLHQQLKIKAANAGVSIKTLVEEYVVDILEKETSQGS